MPLTSNTKKPELLPEIKIDSKHTIFVTFHFLIYHQTSNALKCFIKVVSVVYKPVSNQSLRVKIMFNALVVIRNYLAA